MSEPSVDVRLDCRIEPLRQEHVPALAAAHIACFPGFFLTALGPTFVTFFYDCMVKFEPCFAVVAVDPSGQVAGFAAGAKSGEEFRHYLYHRHFFYIAWTVVKQFVTNSKVRYFLFSRAAVLRKAFRLIMRREPPPPTPRANLIEEPEEQARVVSQVAGAASLMSMGVRSEYRGTGLGEKIIHAFEDLAGERGITCIELSTFKDNARAIAFYEKAGYQICNVRETGVDLFKVCK